MTDLNDKVALITGASRGFGKALGEEIGAAGAQVIAVARNAGGLEELDNAVRSRGGLPVVLVPLDICDDPGLSRLGAAIHERWGRVDLWAHTAVQTPMLAPAEHIEAEELDQAVATNLRAAQRLIRVVDPLLRAAPAGRVLMTHDPTPPNTFNSAYLATKSAQRTITGAWARGLQQTTSVQVIHATLPPMPTALRARFHPGEDTSTLTPAVSVAKRVIERMAERSDAVGAHTIDLRE